MIKTEERYTSLPERFLEKIVFGDECWIWTACKDIGGYGNFRLKGKTVKSHRFSWEHFKGEIPEGMKICHKCDTPACVNPDHLFLGTQKDNVIDMVAKGRDNHAFGETQGSSKLTWSDIDEIRNLYKRGRAPFASEYSVRGLAYKFDVSRSQIRRILQGKSWSKDRRQERVD